MTKLLLLLLLCPPVELSEDEYSEMRRLICAGSAEVIADDDPALRFFAGSLEDRKVALAIERVNSCDGRPQDHRGETR